MLNVRIKEIFAKTILTKTAISGLDFCINPYVGCGHGCRYCYASFMKRFTGHLEPSGVRGVRKDWGLPLTQDKNGETSKIVCISNYY